MKGNSMSQNDFVTLQTTSNTRSFVIEENSTVSTLMTSSVCSFSFIAQSESWGEVNDQATLPKVKQLNTQKFTYLLFYMPNNWSFLSKFSDFLQYTHLC